MSAGLDNGMSRQSKLTRPMSTLTRPSPRASASSSPAAVSMMTCSVFFSAISSEATQRLALPQAATSPPSALRMRMKASARAAAGGSMTMSWSQPTPVCRSAMARTCSAFSASGAAPRVEDDEVVAEPMHLDEGERAHDALNMA